MCREAEEEDPGSHTRGHSGKDDCGRKTLNSPDSEWHLLLVRYCSVCKLNLSDPVSHFFFLYVDCEGSALSERETRCHSPRREAI